MKKLIFNTGDANEILASDSVGAFLRASDGTLLTHTDVGGKKALDVRIAEGINIEVDLSHVDDSVRLGDGTNFFTSTTENGDTSLDVHISNTSIAVTATDLDIRNLVFATDKVDVSGSSVTVTATQLDIDDLNATDDAVSSWTKDGSGTSITSRAEDGGQALDVHITGSGALTVNDAALANTAIQTSAETLAVTGTSENLITSVLANRKYLYVYNDDKKEMFIGQTGVDLQVVGFPIFPGMVLEARIGAAVDVEFDSTVALHKVRTMQLS